ncbi:MAG: siderophore-interacting protein [Nannocystaceae bacterium]|nr:siderophore-interacting protein [Nannocystaceae bacterium]
MALSKQIQSFGVRALGHEAQVTDVHWLSPSVVRVGLHATRCIGVAFAPGCKIKVHVGEGEMRSYTPARVDASVGEMDLVVFVQGGSAASRWVNGLQPGHTVHFLGPASSVPAPLGDEPWAAFYGDETAIGLAEAILAALQRGTPTLGAIETDADEAAAAEHLRLLPVSRGTPAGAGLVQHARTVEVPLGPGVVWLSGEATSVLALREVWLERGVPRDRLRIKPYWSLRGKAHRKALERTVFRG